MDAHTQDTLCLYNIPKYKLVSCYKKTNSEMDYAMHSNIKQGSPKLTELTLFCCHLPFLGRELDLQTATVAL